uniref:Uncharacterized protein n=1 Tax=Ceratitis capitata TaxID=7213 RepID=W8BRD7_CERCA
MLLELIEYATRLLKNNMTTIILAAAATTTTVTANNITTNFTSNTTSTNFTSSAFTTSATTSSSSSSLSTTHFGAMLPDRPTTTATIGASTHPALDDFNSTLKSLFNRTVANVAQSNFSDHSTPYTTLLSSASNSFVGSTTLLPPAPTAPVSRYAMEVTTSLPVQTIATFMSAGNKNRATIIVYPTVSPESIVIPIVSCIFGFPILALLVICCLRRRAKLARERDRRRNYDMQDHAVSLVRFSPIHRLNYRPSRAISLRPERSLSQGFTSLELDTVVEERCSDVDQTQTEILNAESPMETTSSYKMSFSS